MISGLIISANKALPDLRKNDFFSAGALLFYFLVAAVLVAIVLLIRHAVKPYTNAEGGDLKAGASDSPIIQSVIFGDPIQVGSKTLSWWHIPIKAGREIRGCTVSADIDGRSFDFPWRIKQDPLVRRTDLYPDKWGLIPLVARSDKTGGEMPGGTPYPFLLVQGKTRITCLETGQRPENMAQMPYMPLNNGILVVTIKIWADSDPQTAPMKQVYELYNPREDEGNGGFYLRHWDDFH